MNGDEKNNPQDHANHVDLTSAETVGTEDSGAELPITPIQLGEAVPCLTPEQLNRAYPIQSKTVTELTPEQYLESVLDGIVAHRNPMNARALDAIDSLFCCEEQDMNTPESNEIVNHEEELLQEFTAPVEPESDQDDAAAAEAVDAISAEAAEEPVVEPTSAEAAEEPVVEPTSAEAAEEPVADAMSAEAAEEPVADAMSAEAAEEPVAESTSAEAAEEPVAESTSAEAAEEPVADAMSAEAAEEPVADAMSADAAEATAVETPKAQVIDEVRAEIIAAIKDGRMLMAEVTGFNNGGVTAKVLGKKNGFIPNSELVNPEAKAKLVGKFIGVIADQLREPKKAGKSDLVLSQKRYLKRAVSASKIGDTVRAIVSGHVSTGLLVELEDGREHYLPFSELMEQHANPLESMPIGTVLSPLVALRSDVKRLSITYSQRWAEIIAMEGQTVELEVKDYQRNSNDNVAGVLVEFCGVQNVFVPRPKIKGNFPGKGDKIVCLIKKVNLNSNPFLCKVEVDDVQSLASDCALPPRKSDARQSVTPVWSNLQRGQLLDGTMRKVDCNGAQVEVRVGGSDIVADLPYTEISDEDSLPTQVAKLPAPGQPVKVVILNVDSSKRKLTVSMRRAMLANLQPQEMIEGVVKSIHTDDGSRMVEIESNGLKLQGRLRAEDCLNGDESPVGSTVSIRVQGALYARSVWFTQKQS